LDNVVYRLGLAKTRRLARQIVSHGHITVNGTKMTIPSHKVKVDDVIAIRPGSKDTGLFINLSDTHEAAGIPGWLTFDLKQTTGTVKSDPTYDPAEILFDPSQVLEYYSR